MTILIVRPLDKAKETEKELNEKGYQSSILPLIDIEIKRDEKLTKHFVSCQSSVLIITSSYAVRWLTQQVLTSALKFEFTVCVGKKTASAIESSLIKNVDFGKIIIPHEESSEGIIALPELSQIKQQHITLLKGDGGRNLVAKTLQKAGALVTELCVYSRKINQTLHTNRDYKLSDIQCIIVTSIEILDAMLTIHQANTIDDRLLIVASQRIKDYALGLGFSNIYLSQGASARAIADCVTHLDKTGVLNVRQA